ncbi:MAG TPA: 50S ribosomal protein L24 [Steroidobacteraceae bacterium]
MRKFRKGDQVVVLTGRDKGRQGAVIRVIDEDQLIVEGINLVKRHQRPNPQAGKQGGILSKEMPMHVSKVAIWNPATKKADRVGFKILADGKKVRRFSSNGEMLDA